MTDKQPEALRINELFEAVNYRVTQQQAREAAAELRRMHEVNAELLSLLQLSRNQLPIAAASWNEDPEYDIHVKSVLALIAEIDAFLAKAQGENND